MTQISLPLDPTLDVLVVDQFFGISPYQLQQHPVKFDDSCTEALANPGSSWIKPQRLTVHLDYYPPMCSTVLKADKDGNAEVWKMRWDSSG